MSAELALVANVVAIIVVASAHRPLGLALLPLNVLAIVLLVRALRQSTLRAPQSDVHDSLR